MERVLKEWPTYSWTLYGPSYGSAPESFPDHLFYGLDLPEERIFVKNVPMSQLVEELSSARVVLVSLGGECGPISALDAHLAGRPVLSGNDVVYRYSNPDATGIRVVTVDEAYQALVYLLRNPQLCDRLGTNGHQFVLSEFTEKEQRKDLRSILELLDATEPDEYPTFRAHARWREALGIFQERLRRKLRQFRAWSVRL
jgi:glycosyltransferase involved in cell wall biosynthesis